MSIFKKAANAVKKAANAAADAVSSAANGVAQAVASVVEAGANAVEAAANAVAGAIASAAGAVADVLSNVPVIGGVLSGPARAVGAAASAVVRWAGGAVAGTLRLAAAGIKAVGGLVGGVLGGLIRVAGGILTLDGGMILDGLIQVASGIAGAVIVVGGKLIETVQGVLGIQNRYRRLDDEEIGILRRVFWNALGLDQIRIVEGRAGVFGLNSRPFVLGNTIYMKDAYTPSDAPNRALLVHECIHVWQYQHHGTSYASDAIGAQWFVNDEYNWRAEIERGNEEWVDFNPEAQGRFFENLYDRGQLTTHQDTGEFGLVPTTETGRGVFFDADGQTSLGSFVVGGENHTDRANRAVAHVRAARWLGLSASAPPLPPIRGVRPPAPVG
jgi:hypothetical protein